VRRVTFSCFERPHSFSAVSRAYSPFFMFCASGLVFGVTERVGSHFHVLHSRSRFSRYRRRRVAKWSFFMFCAPGHFFEGTDGVGVPFSCFACPDSFSAVPRVPSPIFMFCTPGVVSRGTEGVRSHFHVLRSEARFRRYGGRWVSISCFALPDTFSAVPRAAGPVFMFYSSGLIFGNTEGVRSRFHVLSARLIFGGAEGVRSCFHVLRSRTCFSAVPSESDPIFMFCAPELIFNGLEGDGSRFDVLCAETSFQLCRGRRVPFSCFALPDSFSAVPRASGLDFMFCAPGLFFSGTEGVGFHFHFLRSRTRFRWYQGSPVLFSCFAHPD
jgi:hypothetical protein